ncbi:DAN domain family member 5 [Anguilla anguilla]|uniref:DAN domain family member 5 n=1 Tax=Anguilla anguilla TaxID=7936 RepID=UPI0015A97845|nr:DAN domain family member 5 [Anguilla anguilla]
MILSVSYVFLAASCAVLHGFPHFGFKRPQDGASDFESSGNGAEEPIQGRVKVVQISPNFLRQSALFRRGAAIQNSPSRRGPLPVFLSHGRPGPALSVKETRPSAPFQLFGANMKRRQGQEMWQKAMNKNTQDKEVLALPINPKDSSKQSCAAVPFAQRVSAAGCETVTVQNKLCFGQCSSLYVPPGGESVGSTTGGGISSPCSRCAPSKVRSIVVSLRCRGKAEAREMRVMVVEECKCETGREEENVERTRPQLKR